MRKRGKARSPIRSSAVPHLLSLSSSRISLDLVQAWPSETKDTYVFGRMCLNSVPLVRTICNRSKITLPMIMIRSMVQISQRQSRLPSIRFTEGPTGAFFQQNLHPPVSVTGLLISRIRNWLGTSCDRPTQIINRLEAREVPFRTGSDIG